MVHLEDIALEKFDFGDSPLRVAGLKRYNTSQDEVILDMPVQWGSQVDIRYYDCWWLMIVLTADLMSAHPSAP